MPEVSPNNPTDYFLNTELVVHAGGMSERWWPVTKGKIPKPITDIGKKPRPMIDWVILPYVVGGLKKIFVSLWHNPEIIIEHFEEISKNTDVKFAYLTEPADKRFGRAGVIKHYLEQGILDKNKPKISLNASDIIKVNTKELAKFHCIGLKKGFLATVVASASEPSTFGKVKCNPTTKAVTYFEEKPVIKLPEGEYVNTGIFFLDAELNKLILKIKNDELPVDLEKASILSELCRVMRCFEHAVPNKTWFWCKTIKDYNAVKAIDFEKFFEITNVERFLGPYTPEE